MVVALARFAFRAERMECLPLSGVLCIRGKRCKLGPRGDILKLNTVGQDAEQRH